MEENLIFNLFRTHHLVIDLLGGFRYLGLREDLRIEGITAPLEGQEVFFGGDSFGPPAVTTTVDRFRTRNDFYGGQLGARTRVQWGGGAFVDLTGKLALGGTHEVSSVFGTSSLLVGPVRAQTLPGGILALPSNGGRRSDGEFTAVPEAEIKLGYQFGPCVSCTVG